MPAVSSSPREMLEDSYSLPLSHQLCEKPQTWNTQAYWPLQGLMPWKHCRASILQHSTQQAGHTLQWDNPPVIWWVASHCCAYCIWVHMQNAKWMKAERTQLPKAAAWHCCCRYFGQLILLHEVININKGIHKMLLFLLKFQLSILGTPAAVLGHFSIPQWQQRDRNRCSQDVNMLRFASSMYLEVHTTGKA